VCAEEYGPAALHEFEQPILELSLDERVQVKEWLVHEQHPGFVEQGCQDGIFLFQALVDRLMHRVVRQSSSPKNSIHLSTLLSSSNPLMAATKCRYSSTLRKLGGYSSSGTMPTAALTAIGSAAASIPSTVAVPEVGGSWPLSICRVVVLPAPLGPICKFAELFCKGMRLYGVQCITCMGLKLVLVVYLVFYGI